MTDKYGYVSFSAARKTHATDQFVYVLQISGWSGNVGSHPHFATSTRTDASTSVPASICTGAPDSYQTSQYYYGSRFLEPRLGRWVSRDPSRRMGGGCLYLFCLNNSLQHVDVLGLKELKKAEEFVQFFISYAMLNGQLDGIEGHKPEDIYIQKHDGPIPDEGGNVLGRFRVHPEVGTSTSKPYGEPPKTLCNWIKVILSIDMRKLNAFATIDPPVAFGYYPHAEQKGEEDNQVTAAVKGDKDSPVMWAPFEAIEDHERGHAEVFFKDKTQKDIRGHLFDKYSQYQIKPISNPSGFTKEVTDDLGDFIRDNFKLQSNADANKATIDWYNKHVGESTGIGPSTLGGKKILYRWDFVKKP